MVQADYSYKHESFAGRECLFIEDLNLGNKSVTNDIDNVVEQIATTEKIDPKGYMIVYKDSDGKWDGWDFGTKAFVSLQCDNSYHAVRRFIKIQLNDKIK